MPDWTGELRRRLRGARLGGAMEADVMDELAQHLDDRYRELRSRGETEAEARRLALEELEEGDALARGLRRAGRERPEPIAPGAPRDGRFVGILADVRMAVRVLARTPGFTIMAAFVIMLGVGANTAIFSVVNTMLLRPAPGVAAPEELVAVYTSDYSGPRYGSSSYPDYLAMRESGAFREVTVYTARPLSVTIGERAVKVLGEGVTPGYFGMLGVVPQRGRFFTEEEEGVDGSAAVAVISHGFWQERLGGDPSAVGRELRVNGATVTVVGIAPPEYRGLLRGLRTDVWTPMSAPASIVGTGHDNRGNRGFAIVGRLPEGSALETVQARLNGLAAQLHAAYPDNWTDINDRARVLTIVPENAARVPPQARAAALGAVAGVMAIVAIVLLIACSNVANLMLTRASSRMSEMGVRLALGATRGRIMRQLLTESILLAAFGGTGGVLLALWLTRAVNTVSLPVDLPMTIDVTLDGRVLVFALLITVLTGIVFGLLPALQMSRAPAPMMKATAASARPRMLLRNTLVVVQVASSLVLLTFGSLFLRTLRAADRIDTGMTTENVLLMHVDLAAEGYTDDEAAELLVQLRERIAARPAVQAVAMSAYVPLGLGWSRRGIIVDEYTPQPGEDMEVGSNRVGPGYFEVMGIEFVRGRGFTAADRAGAPDVVVVNEAFARRYWPGRDPIGMRIGLNGPDMPLAEVIGLVPDGKYRSLTEEPTPYLFYPILQHPMPAAMFSVRTAFDAAAFVPSLRAELRALALGMAVPSITTLRSHVGLATLPQRIASVMLTALGGLALLIAGVGLYGVVAYTVAQRTREFGIRSALGAAASDVQKMVVGHALRLAAIGAVVGVALAVAAAVVARSLLLVSPFDPVAIGGVVLLMTATAGLASWVPARRAMRVDPNIALRSE